jgi:non-ribosomal peptide synthetase component F
LPADFPRGAVAGHAAIHSIVLPSELTAMMRRACVASNPVAKMPMAFPVLAAFVLWLNRMVGRQALASIRKPRKDEPRSLVPEFMGEPVLGIRALDPAGASALLPLRFLELSGDSLAAFMDRLRRGLEETCRLGSQTEAAGYPSDPGPLAPGLHGEWVRYQFLFDSLDAFAYSPKAARVFRFAGMEAELVWNARNDAPADLACALRVSEGSAYLDFSYNAAYFKRETVADWSAEMVRLLRTTLERPDLPLSEVFWLSSLERHGLLIDLNRTATSYPRDSSIQDVFERQALRTPEAVALINEEGALTYAELNEKANQLARFLRRYGIARGERIALAAERSLGCVVGALATLKTGCAYVPVDVAAPAHHIQEVLEHSRPAAVLTQARFAFQFARLEVPIVLIDEDWAAVATEPLENLALPIAAEAPACVLYRRSVGASARGILLPHRAFVRLLLGSNFMSFGGGEVFLQLARLTEDAWALEVWGPLLNGGQLAMLPPGWQAPVQIGSAIEHYGATTLWLNAADLHRMVAGHIEFMAPLRQIVTGAGAISPPLMRRLLDYCPRLKVVSGFGPAENGIFSCVDDISLDFLKSLNSIDPVENTRATIGRPIGRPSPNTRVYILGPNRELVRRGEPGELHLAGDGLALGYLHAPELTDQKFFMHSFSPRPRERLFRTGCLACYREGGRIEVLGTIDARSRVDRSEARNQADLVFEAPGAATGEAQSEALLHNTELNGVETIESFVGD